MERSRVQLPAGAPPGNDSGQVANTHFTLLLMYTSVTKQYNLVLAMLYGREGNCRSGVALAMRHGL